MKSMLKWAGGKSWLVNYLKPTFPSNTRLVEPFAGSLSLSLGLEVKTCLLNDINFPLISFFNSIKNKVPLRTFDNAESVFYDVRQKFNTLKAKSFLNYLELVELSECFYYLNRTCFNGLYRENSKGEFNVPYGKYKNPCLEVDFSKYYNLFSNWEFSNKDFERLSLLPNDYLYLDPPYDSDFSKYHKLDFTWLDQQRLVSWAAKHNGPTIISNQSTTRIKELYNSFGFFIKEVEVRRKISANGSRPNTLEVIAYKNIDLF